MHLLGHPAYLKMIYIFWNYPKLC